MPWQVRASIALIAISLAPNWLNDMTDAPVAASFRLWITVMVGVLLVGAASRVSLFRYLLAAVAVVGALFEAYAAVTSGSISLETALITAAQLAGAALLFTRPANRWFAGRGVDLA